MALPTWAKEEAADRMMGELDRRKGDEGQRMVAVKRVEIGFQETADQVHNRQQDTIDLTKDSIVGRLQIRRSNRAK
jgi:hypothetical protein